jgi:hypothetical protein
LLWDVGKKKIRGPYSQLQYDLICHINESSFCKEGRIYTFVFKGAQKMLKFDNLQATSILALAFSLLQTCTFYLFTVCTGEFISED